MPNENFPSFDIIMVTFNRGDYTKKTVASLISSGAIEKCQRFIVVDNHSTDPELIDFFDFLRTMQKTYVITRPQNDGWGTAINDGLGLSRAEFVFFTNNDVIYQPNFLAPLFDAFAHTLDLGICGVWAHTGHSFQGISNAFLRQMDNVPAVGWLIPKSAMEKVGMFPEKGVCLTRGGNGEDTEYVGRMAQHGFIVGVPAKDVATHIDGY